MAIAVDAGNRDELIEMYEKESGVRHHRCEDMESRVYANGEYEKMDEIQIYVQWLSKCHKSVSKDQCKASEAR